MVLIHISDRLGLRKTSSKYYHASHSVSSRLRRQRSGKVAFWKGIALAADRTWLVRDPRLVGTNQGLAHRCIPARPPIPRKFTRQSHLASAIARNRLFSSSDSAFPVGSIPIARSIFRCLACPCVALRDSARRPVSWSRSQAKALHRRNVASAFSNILESSCKVKRNATCSLPPPGHRDPLGHPPPPPPLNLA